jgi:hypothetical protein
MPFTSIIVCVLSTLVHLSLLCKLAHARPRTPSELRYSEPLISISFIIVMVSLLFQMITGSQCNVLYCVSNVQKQHRLCRAISFQPLARNSLECWIPLRSAVRLSEESRRRRARSRAHAQAQRATDRVLLLLRGYSEIMRDGCSDFSARRSVASLTLLHPAAPNECRTDRTKRGA